MGWELKIKARRPRGYWQDLNNLKDEIEMFIEEHDLTPGVMPSKREMREYSRNDLRRAIEQMGGLKAVAETVEMRMEASTRKRKARQSSAPDTSLTGDITAKKGLPLRRKMILNVKDLDMCG